MCRSCSGLCRKCRKRLHQNYVYLVLTGGLYAGAMIFGKLIPRKHSGPCINA